VDPGAATGYAVFVDGLLHHCGLAVATTPPRTDPLKSAREIAELVQLGYDARGIWPRSHLIIEWPQVYTRGSNDRNDLLPLCAIAGAVAQRLALFASQRHVLPRTWQGQMTKDVCHARIKSRLDKYELTVVDAACQGHAPGKRHNILDAVGIGLYSVGRFSPQKVIAR
jgi:hypothetical protein